MRTIETTVYTFNELNEAGKRNAIHNLSDINLHYDWWRDTYEDANQVGIIIEGFDIDRGSYAQIDIEISCYESSVLIVKNHGKDCDTYKTAEAFIIAWDRLVRKYSDGVDITRVTQENEYDFDNEADELEEEFKRNIANNYRDILQKEYEYRYSDAAIIETIEANEYEFTADGKLI